MRIANYVVLLSVFLLAYYGLKLDLSPLASLPVWSRPGALLNLFSGLLSESLITLLLVRIFYPLCRFRLLAYMVVVIYAGINLLQIISFEISSDFVTRLAAGNVEFVGLLITPENVLIVSLVLLGVVILPWLLSGLVASNEKGHYMMGHRRYPLKRTLILSVIMILLGVLLNNARHWMPPEVVNARSATLRINTIARLKPVDQFIRLFQKKPESELFPVLSPKDVIELEKYGFVLNQDKQFPLLKDKIYQSAPPFQRAQSPQPNVIVIFTEGFSARTSSVYPQGISGITPNLEDYAGDSMVVENYYNHTAATYRGLHGGLCSLFPKYGALGGWLDSFEDIPKTRYQCLTDVMRNNGYRSYYFDPHFKDTSGLDEMMQQLNFDEVLNADQLLPNYLNNEPSMQSGWLSDHQMYRSLIGFLQNRKSNEPFFLTMYSVETHAWVDVSEDGVRFENGKRNVLNTIHNMDDAFGLFWDYYQNSDYAKNTIIVFTSDHSHYYSNPYLKLMKAIDATDYQKLFIGRIPLIIHDPQLDLPRRYDAAFSSSISFTPSLIHLLGLPNEQNAFLGRSIFEKNTGHYRGKGVAAYEDKTYLIDRDRIHVEGQQDQYQAPLDLMSRYIRYVQGLEVKNRIYP